MKLWKPDTHLYIVVLGCGRVGSMIANRLSLEGHSVVVVDRDETPFAHLSAEYSGFRIEGDGTQMAVLRKAKLDKADVCIATTHDDNINLMVAQIAQKVFKVPLVIARIFDPKRKDVYNRLGIQTICPTSLAVELLLQMTAQQARLRE